MLFAISKIKRAARLINILIEEYGHATIHPEEKDWRSAFPRLDGDAYDVAIGRLQSHLPKQLTVIPHVLSNNIIEFATVSYDSQLAWYRFLETYYINKHEDGATYDEAVAALSPLKTKFEAAHELSVNFDFPEGYTFSYLKGNNILQLPIAEYWKLSPADEAEEEDDEEFLGDVFFAGGGVSGQVSMEDLPSEMRSLLNESRELRRKEAEKEGRYLMSIPTCVEFERLVAITNDDELRKTYNQSKIVFPELPPVEVLLDTAKKRR